MRSWLWTLPLLAQALLMSIDEVHFHRRRGLPRWERLGHPIDALSVLACLALPWIADPTPGWVCAYAALAAFSCVLITKDESVHTARCGVGEHWIHAALFVLHPVVLGLVALLWSARAEHPLATSMGEWTGVPLPGAAASTAILAVQAMATLAFAGGYALYWQWREAEPPRAPE